jgi:GntR family transcriptional repressor for pyruvate dehydrogenase complex
MKLVRPLVHQLSNPVTDRYLSMLQPIKKKRLSQEAVESIKSYIFERNLDSGERLPTERELSESLSISRASVREALRVLEIMGFIVVKPGSGIYFKGWTDDLALPLSVWLPLNKERLWESYEVRQAIEPSIASLAAQRVTQETIKKMESCMDNFRSCQAESDLAGMILADTEFHQTIARATRNRTLILIMNTIASGLTEGWKASLRTPHRPEKTIIEHQEIYDAIKSRNPEDAKKAMTLHLSRAVKEINQLDNPNDK